MNFEAQLAGEVRSSGLDPDEQSARRRRRQIAIAAGIGIALLVIVAIWLGWHKLHGGSSGASVRAEIPRVSVLSARISPMTTNVTGTGAIAARRDMPVGVVG